MELTDLRALLAAYVEGFSRCRGYHDNILPITDWFRCTFGRDGAAENRDVEWFTQCEDHRQIDLIGASEGTWTTLWTRDPDACGGGLGDPDRSNVLAVRPVRDSDRPNDLARLVTEPDESEAAAVSAMQGRVDGMFEKPSFRLGVAAVSGGLVSSARAAMGGKGIWIIDNVLTVAEHRRRGLGRAVIETLLAEGRSLGARASIVVAEPESLAFYEALGFERRATALTFRALAPDLFFSLPARA